MIHPSITELFIYYRNMQYALEVLRTGELWASKPTSFNDPFDCAVSFEVDYDPSEYVAAIVREGLRNGHDWATIRADIGSSLDSDASLSAAARARIDQGAEQFRKQNSEIGVLFFSEDPLSVVLWSHYGCKHQGVCIGFSRHTGNLLGDNDVCEPVIYSDIFPSPRFSDILRADRRLTNALMYTKARQWAYEKEWRLLSKYGNQKVKIPGPISRIIMGCKSSHDRLQEFRKEANRLGVPFQQARKVDGMFALKVHKI